MPHDILLLYSASMEDALRNDGWYLRTDKVICLKSMDDICANGENVCVYVPLCGWHVNGVLKGMFE